MPLVQDVLFQKGTKVHSTVPNATVTDAVHQMNQHKVGALVVMEDGKVIGMFTERDVLRRIVGEGKDPATTFVGEVMTAEVVCCDLRADLDEVASLMKHRRIRHVPVCSDGGMIEGMISMGDVNAHNASTQQATIHFLNDYIYGRA